MKRIISVILCGMLLTSVSIFAQNTETVASDTKNPVVLNEQKRGNFNRPEFRRGENFRGPRGPMMHRGQQNGLRKNSNKPVFSKEEIKGNTTCECPFRKTDRDGKGKQYRHGRR